MRSSSSSSSSSLGRIKKENSRKGKKPCCLIDSIPRESQRLVCRLRPEWFWIHEQLQGRAKEASTVYIERKGEQRIS